MRIYMRKEEKMRPQLEFTDNTYIELKSAPLRKYACLIHGLEQVRESYTKAKEVPAALFNAYGYANKVIKAMMGGIKLGDVNATFNVLYNLLFTQPLPQKKCEILGKAVFMSDQTNCEKSWLERLQDWFLELVNVTNRDTAEALSNHFSSLRQDQPTSDASLDLFYTVNQRIKTAIEQGLFQYRKEKFPDHSELELSSGKFDEVERSSQSHKVWRELWKCIEEKPYGFHGPCLAKTFFPFGNTKTSAKTFILTELLNDRPTHVSIRKYINQQCQSRQWVAQQWEKWTREHYQFEQLFTADALLLTQLIGRKVQKQRLEQEEPDGAKVVDRWSKLFQTEREKLRANYELVQFISECTDFINEIKTFHNKCQNMTCSASTDQNFDDNVKSLLLKSSQLLASKPASRTKASSDLQEKLTEYTLKLEQSREQLSLLIIDKLSNTVTRWEENVQGATTISLEQLQELETIYRRLTSLSEVIQKGLCAEGCQKLIKKCAEARDLLGRFSCNYYQKHVQPEIEERINFLEKYLKAIDAVKRLPSFYRNEVAQQALEAGYTKLESKINAYELLLNNSSGVSWILSPDAIVNQQKKLVEYDQEITQFCSEQYEQLENNMSWGRHFTDCVRTILRQILHFFDRFRPSGDRIQPESRYTKTREIFGSTVAFFGKKQNEQITCAGDATLWEGSSRSSAKVTLQGAC